MKMRFDQEGIGYILYPDRLFAPGKMPGLDEDRPTKPILCDTRERDISYEEKKRRRYLNKKGLEKFEKDDDSYVARLDRANKDIDLARSVIMGAILYPSTASGFIDSHEVPGSTSHSRFFGAW